jgi:hypothetical protein
MKTGLIVVLMLVGLVLTLGDSTSRHLLDNVNTNG